MEHLRLVHAETDSVISVGDIRRAADRWGVPLELLATNVVQGSQDWWGDSIGHGFLAKDLMVAVVGVFESFLLGLRVRGE